MVDCVKKILSKEGFAGLYKGYKSPLIGAMFTNATMFGSYGFGRSVVMGDSK